MANCQACTTRSFATQSREDLGDNVAPDVDRVSPVPWRETVWSSRIAVRCRRQRARGRSVALLGSGGDLERDRGAGRVLFDDQPASVSFGDRPRRWQPEAEPAAFGTDERIEAV
jgi:hypothetical protein